MYAIVETKENENKKIFRCPMNWIQDNNLRWPNLHGPALSKAVKAMSQPLENWNTYSNFKILFENIGEYLPFINITRF